MLEVQAQLRKARVAILLAKEMLKEKHAEALDEMLRSDPEARRLRTTIEETDRQIELYKDRSPQPERDPGYQRALRERQSTRDRLAKRGEALLQRLLEKTPLDDLLGKELRSAQARRSFAQGRGVSQRGMGESPQGLRRAQVIPASRSM